MQIPEGLTFKFQSLDVLIFGIVKSKQTQFSNELYAQSIFQLFDPIKTVFREKSKVLKQMSKREATSTLLSIWKTITPYDFKLAFDKAISIYIDDLGDSNYSEDIEFEKKITNSKRKTYRPRFNTRNSTKNTRSKNNDGSSSFSIPK